MLDYLKNKIMWLSFSLAPVVLLLLLQDRLFLPRKAMSLSPNGAHLDQATGSLIVRRG